MNSDILTDLYDIQAELNSGIGLISVIADGLSACSRDFSLGNGQMYADALYIAFDTLSGTSGKLLAQLDRARTPGA